MNITEWINGVIGGRYKLVEQDISGNGFTNNYLAIRQKYSVPKLRNRAKIMGDFCKLESNSPIRFDNWRIDVVVDGWRAADCSLFGISLYVTPNSGEIVLPITGVAIE